MKTFRATFAFPLLVVVAGSCATPPPVVQESLALRRVVIYRNGVGYFERSGHVADDKVKFRVRGNEIGDFLATFAVIEAGGSSVRSASFPMKVEPERLQPPPALAGQGAGQGKESTELPPEKLQNVTMELDGKGHDLAVGYIAETPVWRPSYRLVVDKDGAVLQAWGIVQNLSGEDWKGVRLSLIAEAPLAFQAALAKAVIPARPEISDGGEVIAVVPRSETSLEQAPSPPPEPMMEVADNDLDSLQANAPGMPLEKKRAKRESSRSGGGVMPRVAAKQMAASAAPALARPAAPPPPPSRARNLSALAAVAVESGATRYDVPTAVTIPDQSATMVLLLDKRVPGEAVALYAPDPGVPESSSHPFRVARFSNKTGGLLERGPLAIFAEGSFVGQGMVDALPDGATATVPFALERSLAVEQSRESAQEGARVYHIEAGELVIAREAVTRTKYKLRNGADREAKMLVKHARLPGARLNKPAPGTEDNVGTGSALVPASVRGHDTTTIVVDERQQTTQNVDWVSSLADEAITAYLADRRANPVAVAQLAAAWQIRKALVKAIEERSKLSDEESTLTRATEETRDNLKALQKNTAAADLRAKLSNRLAADSARLDVVLKREVEMDLRINELRVRFVEAIRGVKVLDPLPAE